MEHGVNVGGVHDTIGDADYAAGFREKTLGGLAVAAAVVSCLAWHKLQPHVSSHLKQRQDVNNNIVVDFCGTVMVYCNCGSGSDLSSKILPFSVLEATLFPRKLASHFYDFLTFVFDFMLDPEPNPVPEDRNPSAFRFR